MTCMIDARLEKGAPSLAGWQCRQCERGWQDLFKRLVLLSCADRLDLMQRTKLPAFGNECMECTTCVSEENDILVRASVVSPSGLHK